MRAEASPSTTSCRSAPSASSRPSTASSRRAARDLRAVAVPAIEGEIRHHLRDRTQLVRTPRPVVELAGRVRRAQVEIGAREGRLPTQAEIAEAVGASEEQVAEALQSRAPTVELEPENAPAAPDDFADERALLQAGMSVLSQREQRILQMRYYEDRSQVEIAREIGLSQAQVSRLIRRAVDRMRAAVVEDADVAYPREEMATREVEESQPQQQSTHSGRLLVRMPQSLHAELARVAEHEGVSLNTLITGALASSVGWRDGSVDGLAVVDAGAEDDRPAPQRPRWTSIALAANLVVVVLAAARGHRAAGRRPRPRLVAHPGALGWSGWPSPARTEPWSALLEAGRSDDRLVREAYEGARAPVFGELPDDLHPTVAQGAGQRGDRRALRPPGAGAARRVGGDDDRHHRHRERQVAVLQPADARGAAAPTPRRARSTCTRPRRSRRTRRAR